MNMKNGADEEIIEEDWAEVRFLGSLNHILELLEDGVSPAYLLSELLCDTRQYLECSLDTEDITIAHEIIKKFEFLQILLEERVLKGKIETVGEAFAVGQFVENLIYFGMPRCAAIPATAKYLSMGASTVRTHNENYRKMSCDPSGLGRRLVGGISIMMLFIEKSKEGDFPLNHAKAKKSFQKTIEFYQEQTAQQQRFIRILEKIGKKNLPTQI